MPRAKKRVIEGKKSVRKPEYDELFTKEEKIERELARIFHEERGVKKEKRIDKKVKIVKKIAKKSRKNKFLFTSGLGAMILGGTALLLWGLFALSGFFARQEAMAFFTTHTPETAAEYQAGSWSRFLTAQIEIYDHFLDDEWLEESRHLSSLEENIQQLQQQRATLTSLVGNYFLSIFGGGVGDPSFFSNIFEQQTALQNTLATVTGLAEQLSTDDSQQQPWLDLSTKHQQDQALSAQLPEVLPTLLGGNGKRTYAVLLQNNLELRPTGGFIQAVGFLVFDRGLLVDSQVVKTEFLDERITAVVSPPEELSRYLGGEEWHFRDSNWDPDFPSTAQRAAWFIREATGLQVDGVWALNYQFLQDSLEAVGPLSLSEYEEIITHTNLQERVEFHTHDEARNPDKSYAAAVLGSFLQQLPKMTPEQAANFVTQIETGLESKQVLMSVFDTEQEEVFSRLGWNGKIIDPACPTQFSQENCLVNQIFQVETNLSLNRVGLHITREISHRVDLSGERVAHTRLITLKNTARSASWPLGTYRAYVRFIVDNEAELTRLVFNGREVTADELSLYTEGGRKVIGLPIDVPNQAHATIELSYVTEAVPPGEVSFLLFDQKQSGLQSTPTVVSIFNPSRRATLIAPAAEVFGDTVEFRLTQLGHLFTGVSFQ